MAQYWNGRDKCASEQAPSAGPSNDDLDSNNVGPAIGPDPQPANVAPVPPAPQDLFHWWYISTDREGAKPIHRTHVAQHEEDAAASFVPGVPIVVDHSRLHLQFTILMNVMTTLLAIWRRRYKYAWITPLIAFLSHKLTELHAGLRPMRSNRDLYVHHCYGRLLASNPVDVDMRNPGSQSVRLRAPGLIYAVTCHTGMLSKNIASPRFSHIYMEQTGQVSLDVAKADDSYHEGAKELVMNVKTSTDRSCANHLVNLDRRLQQGQVREEVYYKMRSGHELFHAATAPLNMTPPQPWASWTEVISWAILLLGIWKCLLLIRNYGSQLRRLLSSVRSSERYHNFTFDTAWRIAHWSA